MDEINFVKQQAIFGHIQMFVYEDIIRSHDRMTDWGHYAVMQTAIFFPILQMQH